MSSQVTGMAPELSVATRQDLSEAAPLRRHNRLEAWMFVIPAFLFQLIWGWYPLVVAFILSFTDAQPILPSKFTGVASYRHILGDPLALRSLQTTIEYAALSIVLTFFIPILVAILLMEMPPRVMRWMMLLWFLPLSTIASTILWRYVYDQNVGIFQYIATAVLHLPPQPFLNDPKTVLFWIIFPSVLLFGPGLFYMASLQGIPSSYYEAAEVEGAGFWRKIWTISLPRLRPIISMLLIFSIIGSLQDFAFPQILTGGDPGGASRLVVMYMYELLQDQRLSDATALAILLFFVIMFFVILSRLLIKEDPDA